MGFFDNYQDLGGGGTFLKSADKQVLIENGIPFQITGVAEDPLNEYGPRFVAFCVIPNPETGEEEEKKIGFPTGSGVAGRDSMLAQMKAYLESEEEAEPIFVKLDKPGKAILILPAEAPVK